MTPFHRYRICSMEQLVMIIQGGYQRRNYSYLQTALVHIILVVVLFQNHIGHICHGLSLRKLNPFYAFSILGNELHNERIVSNTDNQASSSFE
ncbi:hypothetical protein KUTeg_008744 [Tegillarca granosa]|uniref:Uncharacterized protein n=1 Tax=Tegillarca granosa TaxID=220873 RepID=A0ABQ9FA08_TEGGR|nr:hypothetical protein KUTeg_008744 [Tegillarca granosa]